MDDLSITKVTAISYSLKSVDVKMKTDSMNINVKFHNITLKVSQLITDLAQKQFSDELQITGKAVKINLRIQSSLDNKLFVNQSSINVQYFSKFKLRCASNKISQKQKKSYFDAFELALNDVLQMVLNYHLNEGLLKDLSFCIRPNILQCYYLGNNHNFTNTQQLLNIQPTMRIIADQKYYQSRIQDDYMKGEDSMFYIKRRSRDLDSEIEMNAFTMRSLFPKMNLSSQIILTAQPILDQVVNMTLEEGYTNGTIPFQVDIYEDLEDNTTSYYCSFNVTVVVNISLQLNRNGTCLYIENTDLINFQLQADSARFKDQQSQEFLRFWLRFWISMTNKDLLGNPYLNQYASIQKGQITIDYKYPNIN